MTCGEKLISDFPSLNHDEVFKCECPDAYFENAHSLCVSTGENNCEKCWDQEYSMKAIAIEPESDAKTSIVNDNTPHILDSGARREFESGAVRDIQEGKGRMDLLPWAAIMEISKHCENGAIKYGEHNVDRGIPTHSLCDSAARHLAKYLDGWTDEPHLLAAAWNLLWCVQMEIKNKEMVDTPWKKKDDIHDILPECNSET